MVENPPRERPSACGAQNPENAVDRAPLALDCWTAFSPIGEQWIENAPLLVSQIAPTQCCLLQKGSLESKLDSSVKNRQHGLVPPFTGLTRLHVRHPTTAGRKTSVILSLIRGQKPLAVSAQARWRDRLRFHDFRHDFGTKLLRATGNLKLVQRALNHANIKTTTRYAHVLDDQVAAPWSALPSPGQN